MIETCVVALASFSVAKSQICYCHAMS